MERKGFKLRVLCDLNKKIHLEPLLVIGMSPGFALKSRLQLAPQQMMLLAQCISLLWGQNNPTKPIPPSITTRIRNSLPPYTEPIDKLGRTHVKIIMCLAAALRHRLPNWTWAQSRVQFNSKNTNRKGLNWCYSHELKEGHWSEQFKSSLTLFWIYNLRLNSLSLLLNFYRA